MRNLSNRWTKSSYFFPNLIFKKGRANIPVATTKICGHIIKLVLPAGKVAEVYFLFKAIEEIIHVYERNT